MTISYPLICEGAPLLVVIKECSNSLNCPCDTDDQYMCTEVLQQTERSRMLFV